MSKTQEPLIEEELEKEGATETNTTTVIVEVLDRSGSMAEDSFIDEVRNGYNQYIKDNIAMPGKAVVFTVVFDTDIEVIVDGIPVEDVPLLTEEAYHARGGTALNDAIAVAIERVSEWLAEQPKEEYPDNILVEIQTDGFENSSRRYNRHNHDQMEAFRELVSGKEKAGWVFSYVGCDGDAVGAAVSLGISPAMAARTATIMTKSSAGNAALYNAKTSNIRSVRTGEASINAYAFSDLQKSEMHDGSPLVDNGESST